MSMTVSKPKAPRPPMTIKERTRVGRRVARQRLCNRFLEQHLDQIEQDIARMDDLYENLLDQTMRNEAQIAAELEKPEDGENDDERSDGRKVKALSRINAPLYKTMISAVAEKIKLRDQFMNSVYVREFILARELAKKRGERGADRGDTREVMLRQVAAMSEHQDVNSPLPRELASLLKEERAQNKQTLELVREMNDGEDGREAWTVNVVREQPDGGDGGQDEKNEDEDD